MTDNRQKLSTYRQ